MRLIADVLLRAENYLNATKDRELNLRGLKIPAIENLAVVQDQFDTIDFSDNDIRKLDNFPVMKRLTTLLLPNNNITRIGTSLFEYIPNLQNLILTNNKVSNFIEIDYISNLNHIEHLSLLENPISYKPYYRQYVIYKLPSIKSLDFQKVKLSERQEANKFFTETAEGKDIIAKTEAEKISESTNHSSSSGSSNSNHTHPSNTLSFSNTSFSSISIPSSNTISKPAVVTLSDSQKQEIREAISNAATKDEVDRIEHQLRTGTFPFKSVTSSNSVNSTSTGNVESRGTKRGRVEGEDDDGEDRTPPHGQGVLVT